MLKTLKQWLCKHDLTMLVFDLKSMTVRERCRLCGWEKDTGDKVSGSFSPLEVKEFVVTSAPQAAKKPASKKKPPDFSWQEERALLRMRAKGKSYAYIQGYFEIRFSRKCSIGALRTKHWKLTHAHS